MADEATREVHYYVRRRNQIQEKAGDVMRAQTKKIGKKMELIEFYRQELRNLETQNEQLEKKVEKYLDISETLVKKRELYMSLFASTSKAKSYVTLRSFQEPALRDLLLRTSQNSPKANKKMLARSHVGITFEDKERKFIKRLDVIEINAGKPRDLVEWLAFSFKEDRVNYYQILCLTYRYYMKTEELLATIKELYTENLVEGAHFAATRMNFISFVNHWIRYYFEQDFEPHPTRMKKMKKFLRLVQENDGTTVSHTLAASLKRITITLEKKVDLKRSAKALTVLGAADDFKSKLVFSELPPKSLSHKEPLTSYLDIPPKETARQMSLIDHSLFQAIQPKECLKCAWSGKNQAELAPNILSMIEMFNLRSSNVITSVVNEPERKVRSALLAYWLAVVEELYLLNNFNGMVVIVASLSSSSIYRLKKTWQGVPRAKVTLYSERCALMSPESSSKQYRKHLRDINPPLVPHLGLYLQDLTFIEDGNPLKFDDGLINFGKCRMIGSRILEMKTYQDVPYNIIPVPEIQKFLKRPSTLTEDEQFGKSLLAEPRRTKK